MKVSQELRKSYFYLSKIFISPSSSSEPLIITITFSFSGALLSFIFISETEQWYGERLNDLPKVAEDKPLLWERHSCPCLGSTLADSPSSRGLLRSNSNLSSLIQLWECSFFCLPWATWQDLTGTSFSLPLHFHPCFFTGLRGAWKGLWGSLESPCMGSPNPLCIGNFAAYRLKQRQARICCVGRGVCFCILSSPILKLRSTWH